MLDRQSDRGFIFGSSNAFEPKCHRCGQELPLFHPHIMIERYDENENVICESCYAKHYGNPK